jgi:hypothetical protein
MTIGILLASTSAAVAETGDSSSSLDLSPTRFDAQPAAQSSENTAKSGGREPFGSEGSQWLTVGTGVASDFESATDWNLHLAWSIFLVKDVEFALEGAGWYFNQPGDNTGGVSGSFLFRWHFVNTGAWSVYADAGIGLLGAFDEVPDGGTSFDFLPRLGVGLTRQISDDGTRLQVGLRWHHISNARINGDEDNPSRDGAMLYAGVMFPF